MRKTLVALALALFPAFAAAQYCPTCVQNSASPQNAQINIGTATIRGYINASTATITNAYLTNVNITNLSGNGSAVTNLNSSQLLSGAVPSAALSGNYPAVTGVGAVASGVWHGTAVDTTHGGTGQNLGGVLAGAIPFFSATGVISTLAGGTPQGLLQTNGTSAPAWTNAPAVNGANIVGIPPANLAAGNLPHNVIVSSNSIPYIDGASVIGNISGSAASSTPFDLVQISSYGAINSAVQYITLVASCHTGSAVGGSCSVDPNSSQAAVDEKLLSAGYSCTWGSSGSLTPILATATVSCATPVVGPYIACSVDVNGNVVCAATQGNTISGFNETVSGGSGNFAGGGNGNFVGGGFNNSASGQSSALVCGGTGNTASGQTSSILGGNGNTASGNYSSVVGSFNTISGDNSVGLGTGVSASGARSFFYSDGEGGSYAGHGDWTFNVHATNGSYFDGGPLNVTGSSVNASAFFGDGSHLSGISGQSNTFGSSVTVNSNLGTFGTYDNQGFVPGLFGGDGPNKGVNVARPVSGALAKSFGYTFSLSDGISTQYITGAIVSSVTSLGSGASADTVFLAGSDLDQNAHEVFRVRSTGEAVAKSSVTASAFFGDASHLSGIPITTPAGSTGDIQYKTSGNTFGASGLNWDGTRLYSFAGSAGDIFSIRPRGEVSTSELFGNENVHLYSTGVNAQMTLDGFQNITLTAGSHLNLQGGGVQMYYCSGSTGGTYDGNLARGNGNATACAGGTWVATAIYLP